MPRPDDVAVTNEWVGILLDERAGYCGMEGGRRRMEGSQFEDCCGQMKDNQRRIGGSRETWSVKL